MIEGIVFNSDKYEQKEEYNVIEFTENTVILCNNLRLMTSLAEEIVKTVNGEAEYNDYWCEDEDVGKAKYVLNFGLQKIIDINGQRITLGLEPALIYKANKPEDIWLFDVNGFDKEAIWPMLTFKGSHDLWNAGKDEVYKTICNGRYGCYDGQWIDTDEDLSCDKQEELEEDEVDI